MRIVLLAFVAALQSLPPRQRAVLILRDVLDWKASEGAALLSLSVPSANSALYRARVIMSKNYDISHMSLLRATPADEATREVLDRYVEAWQSANISKLVMVLKEDAILFMPPSPSWYRGRDSVAWVVAGMAFGGDASGRWRLLPTRANAQPAFALYMRPYASQLYLAFAIQVIRIEGNQIADMATFLNPALMAKFALPTKIEE